MRLLALAATALLVAASAVTGCDSSSSADSTPPTCALSVSKKCVVPPNSRVLFVGDYDTGDLSQWDTLQTRGWNQPPGNYCGYNACVRDGGPMHGTAARFEIRDGDVPPFGGGIRSEVRTPADATSSASVSEGDERWYELSVKFDESFENPRTGAHDWLVIMQWLPSDNSVPALTLQVSRFDMLELGGDERSVPYRRSIGQLDRGTWVKYLLHVKFSSDPSTGFVEVWRDGHLRVPLHYRPTLAAGRSSYLKQGVYRSADSLGTQVVWHDDLRVIAP